MQKLGWSMVAALVLVSTGCGDAVLEANAPLQNETILEDVVDHRHGELLYWKTAEDVEAAFEGGQATLEASRSFEAVSLQLRSPGSLDLQWSSRDATTGEWSEWQQLPLSWRDGEHAMAKLTLSSRADALRFAQGEDLTFLRAELLDVAPPETGSHFDDDWYSDEELAERYDDGQLDERIRRLELSKAGRWAPPNRVQAVANTQSLRYTGGSRWDGGSHCGGRLLAGTRTIGDYIVSNFRGARSYGGYSCRRNTASTNRMSVHGTGRALDIFVPLDRGQADNDLGDPIAHWLMQNAEEIGVELIIWDRASWGAHRGVPKMRNYTGPHPHHDHLHVEFSPAAARKATAWFSNRGGAPVPDPGNVPNRACSSKTLGRDVPHGECVQMAYAACGGGTCNWAECNDGAWVCTGVAACSGKKHGHSQCQAGPAPDNTPCWSKTLNKNVDAGACVQMAYAACGGGTCNWARCVEGAWSCTDVSGCGQDKHGHAACQPAQPAQPAQGDSCWSKTLGRNASHGELVQMAYAACDGNRCNWARCDDGDWNCTDDLNSGSKKSPHAACQ